MIRAFAMTLSLLTTPAHAESHNVILFVPDGLRAGIVDETTAPTMADIRKHGVAFANSFSQYPTFTMVNASAFATGHHPGDTGVFANTIFTSPSMTTDTARKSVTPFLEFDWTLRDMNAGYGEGRNFLNEETLIAAARRAGLSTAAVGKLGPAGLQAIYGIDDGQTIVIDDITGKATGVKIPEALAEAIEAATGRPAIAPARGANGFSGSCEEAGTTVANVAQEAWMADVTTKVILPRFKAAGKPFFLVFWSRDPDGTQHNHGDNPGQLTPGINGPTSRAGIRNADDVLGKIRAAVHDLGLDSTTDIIVSADHGFSTIAKESRTSGSAVVSCAGLAHALPQGFLGMDIARALDLPGFDPDNDNRPVKAGEFSLSSRGSVLIGRDPAKPEIVVTANGGSDAVYLPTADSVQLAPRIVSTLLEQDYVSGIFADDSLGKIPGTLPLSAIDFVGAARTIRPAMVVNFRSFATGCANPLLCAAELADTPLVQGQGMHGSFSRADTNNFMAAIGPSFKAGYVDRAPTSNADVPLTIARILGLTMTPKGKLAGRVLAEALNHGSETAFTRETLTGLPANGLATTIIVQHANGVRYLEAGGFPGRTVGLDAPPR